MLSDIFRYEKSAYEKVERALIFGGVVLVGDMVKWLDPDIIPEDRSNLAKWKKILQMKEENLKNKYGEGPLKIMRIEKADGEEYATILVIKDKNGKEVPLPIYIFAVADI
ncbi:MAG: hypothetical protein QMD86_01815 [Patescibacteria group bacterium]|nr:hypothetical protein [Patescibacteria group bacterium]